MMRALGLRPYKPLHSIKSRKRFLHGRIFFNYPLFISDREDVKDFLCNLQSNVGMLTMTLEFDILFNRSYIYQKWTQFKP